jgi:hypothetical protein
LNWLQSKKDPAPPPVQSSEPAPKEPEFEEPEFDPSEEEDESSEELFPTTHELLLKDHTKVVSALALDPSGARIVSGSHDYDCKLWDFGGMDWRCKPFNSWEPAGTYYVGALLSIYTHTDTVFRYTTSNSQMTDKSSSSCRALLKPRYTTETEKNSTFIELVSNPC